jgi:hypothetical protein
MRVLVDQVGYETTAPKVALISGAEGSAPTQFTLVDDASGKVVFSGTPATAGHVDHWGDRTYWKADFSAFATPGHYVLRAVAGSGTASSCSFQIEDNLLERATLSNVLFYFKGQRASGDMDRADRHLSLPDGKGTVDVHGGWYDATGDYGIHLSHQNPTSYFNPQQVPLVAWTLLASYDTLKARQDDNFSEYERRLLDEGLFGADFLVRLKRPGERHPVHAERSSDRRRAIYLSSRLSCRGRHVDCCARTRKHHAAGWRLYAREISADGGGSVRFSRSAQSRAAQRSRAQHPR